MGTTKQWKRCIRIIFFRITSVVFAVVILPVLAFSLNSTDEQARKHLLRGSAAIEMAKGENELGIAAEEFRRATEMAPNMSAAWYNLGRLQSRMGQFKEAIDSYNRYLTLAPQAQDAMKVRDEVTKLEFKLEQTNKFNSLSGQWITDNGNIAIVAASNGKLTIESDVRFNGEYDYYMKDPIAGAHYDASPTYSQSRIDLVQKGNQFVGIFETSAYKPGQLCTVPPQKSEITGSAKNDFIVLKLQRMKFIVAEKYNGLLSVEPLCVNVQSMGAMNVEIVLRPLPPGGILKNAGGLEENDEIISVNGTDLTQLNGADHVRKLRGQPGTTAQLVVKRLTGKAGFFSAAKYANINVTVPFVAVNPTEKGWLGIEMQTVTPEIAKSSGNEKVMGVFVKNVLKNGPADKSGLKSGDIIVAVDDKPIQDQAAMFQYVNSAPGKNVRLKLFRNGKAEETTATIERRESDKDPDQRKRLAFFYTW